MDGQEATVMAEGAVRTSAERRSETSYQQAFVEAYQRYYPKMFAYVYSRVGDVEATKDLVAEVFEKAYAKGHTLREPAAYSVWLFMIAKNVLLSHYRWNKRETSGMDSMKESLWLSERPSNPEDGALQSEAISNLMRHLRGLSERDQELLSLKFDADLSYAEISLILRLSQTNVRVSIFRALRRLRSLIEEETAWATA